MDGWMMDGWMDGFLLATNAGRMKGLKAGTSILKVAGVIETDYSGGIKIVGEQTCDGRGLPIRKVKS